MRYKRGSRVEVLSRNGESCGVWRCAEILSCNGCTFSVLFDCSSEISNDLVAKVSRKEIRPCPPLNDVTNSWSPGDLVEVREDFSWKTAVILKVLSPNYYSVKLIGSSRELRLSKVDLRVRQLWQDGQWIVIKKGSQIMEESKTNKLADSSSYVRMSSPRLGAETTENCFTAENNTGFLDSCVITDRTRKRSSPFLSSDRKASKIRTIEKKVQAVTSNNWERERPNFCVDSFQTRSLGLNDSTIDECSVGSCSVISNNPSKLRNPAIAGNSCDEDSDAESFYGLGEKERRQFSSIGVNVAVRIHSLELQAYRSTLEAFYASGPLSWEQEVLLTNLRMSLNISNDEHLLELKNVIAPHVR